jgi:diguanylate cyclase (GGDEF)-like protein
MASTSIKSTLKLDTDSNETKLKQNRAVILAILLGVLGAVLNSFPIELAYNISLIIGNLAFIIAAAYLRPLFTLLCALICVAPLLISWGHPFGFLTFGLEGLFVSYMRGRGWYLPTADVLYWLLIGMPLTAIIIWFNSISSQGYFLFSLFKQSINAIFYTTLAVILIFVFGDKVNRWIKSQQPPLVKNLKQYLHYILWIMSAFFVVGVCLFLSRNLNDIQQQQFEDKLDISSQYLGHIIENYIDDHKKAIAQAANKLSAIDPEDYNEALGKTHKLYPGFLTMLIANQTANIVSSSPQTLIDSLPESGFSVVDRAYFREAFFNQSLYISPVFLGRGFGSDSIIAISAPIYRQNNPQPVGIVEGSLNLNLFAQLNRYAANDREIDVVLTDEKDNVIYSEAKLALTTLSRFNYEVEQVKLKGNLITIETTSSNKKRYLYRQISLNNGWKVFVLIEHGQILQLIEQQYVTIFMSLALIFIFVILLAHQVANTLNRPLAFALKELARNDGKRGFKPIPYEAPIEFLALYKELQQSKESLLNQQSILEETVERRTQDLNEANKTLKNLANKDSLTGLHNRRYLEKQFNELQAILSRNDAAMMVAMLDLDHFKKFNDQYGHLIGDNCLVFVSKAMQGKFDRRSDIVARFGGEEFIIITQHDPEGGVLEKLDELREEIACICIPTDCHQYIGVTISIGTITANASFSKNLEDWIRLADEQLYQAKNNGRNQISSHTLA